MTNITNRTTVKQLIELGVTFEQIESLVVKAENKNKKSKEKENQIELMSEIFDIMFSNPNAEWKTGSILKTWFPEGKSQIEEVENERKQKHSQISQALKALSDAGKIAKHNQTNTTSGTFYTVVLNLPAVIK